MLKKASLYTEFYSLVLSGLNTAISQENKLSYTI
jgi:hypothetical protein